MGTQLPSKNSHFDYAPTGHRGERASQIVRLGCCVRLHAPTPRRHHVRSKASSPGQARRSCACHASSTVRARAGAVASAQVFAARRPLPSASTVQGFIVDFFASLGRCWSWKLTGRTMRCGSRLTGAGMRGLQRRGCGCCGCRAAGARESGGRSEGLRLVRAALAD